MSKFPFDNESNYADFKDGTKVLIPYTPEFEEFGEVLNELTYLGEASINNPDDTYFPSAPFYWDVLKTKQVGDRITDRLTDEYWHRGTTPWETLKVNNIVHGTYRDKDVTKIELVIEHPEYYETYLSVVLYD